MWNCVNRKTFIECNNSQHPTTRYMAKSHTVVTINQPKSGIRARARFAVPPLCAIYVSRHDTLSSYKHLSCVYDSEYMLISVALCADFCVIISYTQVLHFTTTLMSQLIRWRALIKKKQTPRKQWFTRHKHIKLFAKECAQTNIKCLSIICVVSILYTIWEKGTTNKPQKINDRGKSRC